MTRHNPHTPSDHNSDSFDLSDIFIGREQQLDLFEIYLNRWKQLIFDAELDDTLVTSTPSPNNKIQGLVVLLYGRGGFGKSTLLRYYHEMVLQDDYHLMVSKIIDWEFAVEGKRSLFNPPQGQEVDTSEYFKLLCSQLATALNKKPREFKEYQSAVKDVERAGKEANDVLESMQKDDNYGWLRELTVETITSVVRAYVPGSNVVLNQPGVKSTVNKVAKITQEQVSRVRARLHDKLGSRLGNYLEPSLQLGLALGYDLREFAKNFPVLIFFDTYEEVDEGDRFLRMVMGAAGVRVGWVLAGRDNLWAGLGQRERSIAMEYGYKDIVPSNRGLSVNFNAGDVGAFTLSDVIEYFTLLRKKTRHELPLSKATEEGAKRVLDVTQGVPLAVKIAAGLYLETADLNTITENVEGRREIVERMVYRYLLHTRTEQDERAELYGLAMLRRADQPNVVAAALGLTSEQARNSYVSELSHLHRRYSFIFSEKEEPALHQEVRHFLRQWLLERRTQPEIVAVNERLKKALEAALKRLENQRKYGTLKERLQDDEWVGIYLDLAEQQFWLDPVEGVRHIMPCIIAAAVYRRDTNEDAAKVGEFFKMQVGFPYRNWWKWMDQSLTYVDSRNLSWEAQTGLEELVKLASQRCPTFPQPLPDYREELEAALWWRLGEAYRGQDDNKALEWYTKALTRLDQETELKEDTASTCLNLAQKHYGQGKDAESIPVLDKAIELKPRYTWAYTSRGVAYADLKEYQQALADFDRAIELAPNDARIYYIRGSAYANLEEHQQAIADYNRAIELDPSLAGAYTNRGNIYRLLGEYQMAIEDYNRAIGLDTNLAAAYTSRGLAYADLKDYQRAIADHNRAIELVPNDAAAYYSRGVTYYHLREYQRAIEDYSHAIALAPIDARIYYYRGRTHADLEDYQQAIADFDRAIKLDPELADAYYSRGMVCKRLKEYQRAIDDYSHVITLDPSLAAAYTNRGNIYRLLGEYQMAIEDYNRAIGLDTNLAAAYTSRGLAYADLKDYQRAIDDSNHAIDLDPNDTEAYLSRGVTYYHLREYQRAIADFDRVITLDPLHDICYTVRGVAYADLKEYQQALADFDRAIELAPNDARIYYIRGSAHANLEEHQQAIADYNRAIELDPNEATIYFSRGRAHADLKEYQRALADYNRAIELDPSNADHYINRGNAYGILKEYNQAIADYDRTIALDLNNVSAYANRGIVYTYLKNSKQAIANCDRAIELAPNNAEAYCSRGIAYASLLKEYQRALADFDRAIELDPSNAEAYTNRGSTYVYLKEYQRAIADYDHAVELNPNFLRAYIYRGTTYLWLKKNLQAKTDYRRCYDLDPTQVEAAWMAEWVGMGKQRPTIETAQRLETIAMVDPEHYAACVCRGVALGLHGKVKEGLEEMERAILLATEVWSAYFWKGLLAAYHQERPHIERVRATIKQSLDLGLPPVLLTPLYWLEKDRPDVFLEYAKPLLERYGV